ncbi:MAG TPA: hypothetical protein VMF05_11600 [Stellaceae bacterium]|nr:hypothetical protein [Stellaceae bacterium]
MANTQEISKQHPKSGTTPRQRAEKEILRARPVEGEVDHGALTREIIARFPNILAELAK